MTASVNGGNVRVEKLVKAQRPAALRATIWLSIWEIDMAYDKEFGHTGKQEWQLAFPTNGNKWVLKNATLSFGAGFLDSVDGVQIPHTTGQYGWTGQFYVAKELVRLEGGKLIGNIDQWRVNDGQIMNVEQVARGAEVSVAES